MPYEIQHKDGKWLTVNKETNKVKGTHATRKDAVRQMRLLYMVEGGKTPTGKASTMK